MPKIDVLIPTYNRPSALAVTLTSLCFQELSDFGVTVADQSTHPVSQDASVMAAVRVLESHGNQVQIMRNLPRKGMAQQRQFLLDSATAPYCLFLDDDVILEPYVLRNLLKVLTEQGCGFAGNAVIGLSYRDDVRPHQQNIEFWEERVQPEEVRPHTPAWERYQLHNAANVLHVQHKIPVSPQQPRPYKVAWVGGCVLYDTAKLREAGGFSFWEELPHEHAGEDALAQLRVMKRYGGCGVLPSGAYHQEHATTIPKREVDAPKCLQI